MNYYHATRRPRGQLKFLCKNLLLGICLMTCYHVGIAQSSVSGTVSHEQGDPLVGASVLVKGTQTGALTDTNGEFTLSVAEGMDTLLITYIGYEPKEVSINGRSNLVITLSESISTLDEVVVTGYGTQRKSDVTGAVVKVGAEDFVKGVNTNALQLLNGKASGVQVSQSSSEPGGAIDIKIRGTNSINSSNDVLIVIDGLPGGDINALSPDDIESIEVLKDASASAIYGSRAANGVVLITTKKGRKNSLDITYNGYVAFQDVNERVDMLNGREYLTILNEINVESGGGIIHPPEKIEAVGEGYDWQDIIFQSAITHNHQLSFTGGGEKSRYYVGMNYIDQEGVMMNTGLERYNARINYELAPNDKFTLSVNLNANRSLTDRIKLGRGTNENVGVLSAMLLFDPTVGPERNEEGFYDVNPLVAIENPMALLQGIDILDTENTLYGTASAEYEIIPGLNATLRVGTQINNFRNDTYENNLTQIGRGLNGRGSVRTSENFYWIAEYLASYEKSLGDHEFKILGGITFENFENKFLQASVSDFLSDDTGTNLLQSGNPETRQVQSGKFINRLNSQLGRLNYAFRDKYLLTASIRRDGTSRFSDKNKYAVFPSASIGWKISEESFMGGQSLFNNLKLRIGYGEIGNQGINNFETIQTFRAGSNAVLGGALQNGAVPARVPNEDLVWETTREVNIGIDYGILSDRISGSIELYERNTDDQLFQRPIPLTTGFTNVRVNLGQVRNRGIDFQINTHNLVGRFKWDTDLALSILENEVIQLPEFAQQIIYGGFGFSGNYLIVQEGVPIASFYGYEIDGIFQVDDDIESSAQPNAVPGHPRFVDTNNDGRITADDKVILGDPFPDFTFGLTNRFTFDRFNLEIYIIGVEGVETFNNLVAESLYPINKERNHLAKNYLDRWTVDNPDAEFPSGVNYTAYSDGENKVNTFTVQDASFIRLRNATLGYNVPVDGIGFLNALNVFVSGENLFTLTRDYDGFDPDGNSDGPGTSRATFTNYPIARTLRIGAVVNF